MRWLALFLLAGCTEYGLWGGLRPVEDPLPGDDAASDDPWWQDPWAEPPEGWDDPVDEEGTGDDGPQDAPIGSDDDADGDGYGDGTDDGATTPDGTALDDAARMTGGGVADGASHGFTVHCAFTHHATHLEVNTPSGAFHLDGVDWVVCLDDPAVHPAQPVVGFDTVVGVGWGSWRGGEADVWFRFSDDGEPGVTDEMAVEVDAAVPWSSDGALEAGNHQAHVAL